MNSLFKYFFLLLLFLLTCCSEKNELIVDEFFVSKHNVGPRGNNTIFYFNFPKPKKEWGFRLREPCERGFKIRDLNIIQN